tara:strand:- start:6919 stop:7770 length:852 start_codon:yes stop_codon:yes gene_type:complete
MKPLPSSKKLTLWGNAMKLEKAFQKLRETDHSDSFEGLDSWLDQNTKKKRPMKSIYKIAASFTLIAVIFIACSVPVEQNQEIGYMIKGVSSLNQPDIKSKMMSGNFASDDIGMSQVNINTQVMERDGEEPEVITEVMMILPEADYELAESKRAALNEIFNFSRSEILPIEGKVEKSFFESTLERFDINLNINPDLTEEEIELQITNFLKEQGEHMTGEVEVSVDELGRKVVEIKMEAMISDTNGVQVETGPDGTKQFRIIKNEDGSAMKEEVEIEWTVDNSDQ